MQTTKEQPRNYEEWLKSAPTEELVKGLYERLQGAYAEIKSLTDEINNLKMGMVSHKHDSQTGVATLPMSAVVPIATR